MCTSTILCAYVEVSPKTAKLCDLYKKVKISREKTFSTEFYLSYKLFFPVEQFYMHVPCDDVCTNFLSFQNTTNIYFK
jgi:hypothetical protein